MLRYRPKGNRQKGQKGRRAKLDLSGRYGLHFSKVISQFTISLTLILAALWRLISSLLREPALPQVSTLLLHPILSCCGLSTIHAASSNISFSGTHTFVTMQQSVRAWRAASMSENQGNTTRHQAIHL
jgi:hypothetical protein